MTVYYQSRKLIIVHHLRPTGEDGANTIQLRLMSMLGGGLSTIYNAHEIWFYDHNVHLFTAYKNRNGTLSLLKSYLADKGINVKPDAISIRTGQPSQHRFVDDKDHFLFNLTFGK